MYMVQTTAALGNPFWVSRQPEPLTVTFSVRLGALRGLNPFADTVQLDPRSATHLNNRSEIS